jgi:hypothetical protein
MPPITRNWPGNDERGYWPLPTTDLEPFEPQRVLYRELIVAGNPDRSRYRNIYWPKFYRKQKFPQLLRTIAAHQYSSANIDPPEYHPLDIHVFRRSLLIFQLPRGTSDFFAQSPVVFTVDTRDAPADLYGGLSFVDTGGTATKTWFRGCQLIYFQARFKGGSTSAPHRAPFNFKLNDDKARALTIDPDIRHPGIGGYNAEDDGTGPRPRPSRASQRA